MKKISTIIVCLLFCLVSFAQQALNNLSADIILSNKAEKIDKQEMMVRSQKLSANSEFLRRTHLENLYKIEDETLSLWDGNHSKIDNRSIEQIKSEALALYKYDDSILVKDAAIKTINNHQFLIIKYQKGDVGYIRFMSDPKNRKSLNGLIEFKRTDQQKAESDITELLNNTKIR